MIDPLEALLQSALNEAGKRKIKPLPGKDFRLSTIKESFKSTYEKPENWERTRGIALMHRSHEGVTTLLGNFSEFVHRKNKQARKLVREAAPLAVTDQEFVSGDWWLRTDTLARIQDRNNHEVKYTTMDILLDELQVFAHKVSVRIHLHDGWIARVELADQTQFICPVNSQFLFLPKGLDVLEGMSYDSKVVLKNQMGV